MREIKLTRNKITIVDDEIYEYLIQWKWHVNKGKTTYYAVSKSNLDGRRHIKMHNLIWEYFHGPIKEGTIIDHINRDGLFNLKSNLREASQQQNCMNRTPYNGTSCKYKGVSKKNKNCFLTRITKNGYTYFLGFYPNELNAALVYDAYAMILFGGFACLNFPLQSIEVYKKALLTKLIKNSSSKYRGLSFHKKNKNGKPTLIKIVKELSWVILRRK